MVTRSESAAVATLRVCRQGLGPKTQLPRTANQIAAASVLLARTSGLNWSRDIATLDRVLAHLREM